MNTWYIGTVVDIIDPDKRRRLKVRGPKVSEEAVPDDKLNWLNPFQLSKDHFDLPDVNSSVLILGFDKAEFWIELPDKASWSEFSDDDYPTAFLSKHKDVYSKQFTESEGFAVNYVGDIKVNTDSTETIVTEESISHVFNDVTIKTDGSNLNITVGGVEIDTDGSKISVKNNGSDLKTAINDLFTAIYAMTVQTAQGPSSPPINTSAFKAAESKFNSLLK